jgi:GTP-binding GTPase Middle Region
LGSRVQSPKAQSGALTELSSVHSEGLSVCLAAGPQVELAQSEYQLPRLTKMWSHLERQSGSGRVKGMGEKQIEVDKRLLRKRMAVLREELDVVCPLPKRPPGNPKPLDSQKPLSRKP